MNYENSKSTSILILSYSNREKKIWFFPLNYNKKRIRTFKTKCWTMIDDSFKAKLLKMIISVFCDSFWCSSIKFLKKSWDFFSAKISDGISNRTLHNAVIIYQKLLKYLFIIQSAVTINFFLFFLKRLE